MENHFISGVSIPGYQQQSPQQQKEEGALRFDKGKLRWDLVPPEFERVVEVYTVGAKKYTRKFINKWEGFWNVLNVKRLELIMPEVCVVDVTNVTSSEVILSIIKDKKKILNSGQKEIKVEKIPMTDYVELILNLEKETKEQSGWVDSLNTDSLRLSTLFYVKPDVKSVALQNTFTLITTIQQGNSEVYFVVNATTVLDSLEITFKELQKLWNISKKVNLLEISGDRNWEKGMSWGRCFGSLMRHSWAYWRGEDLDPETGCHHMAMAAWNCIALLTYSIRRVGTDDRQNTSTVS